MHISAKKILCKVNIRMILIYYSIYTLFRGKLHLLNFAKIVPIFATCVLALQKRKQVSKSRHGHAVNVPFSLIYQRQRLKKLLITNVKRNSDNQAILNLLIGMRILIN